VKNAVKYRKYPQPLSPEKKALPYPSPRGSGQGIPKSKGIMRNPIVILNWDL